VNQSANSPAALIEQRLFSAFKIRDYLYLWLGMLGSAFAMNMQLVAQGWLVYEMTSSPIQLTWVTLSFMLPQVFFSLIGGVLADRIRKKPLIGWSPMVNGIATIYLTCGDFFRRRNFLALHRHRSPERYADGVIHSCENSVDPGNRRRIQNI
jgi:hypothetical protein